jgi:hypothetical protein
MKIPKFRGISSSATSNQLCSDRLRRPYSLVNLSLDMDSPELRPVQLPALGKVVQFREVGGLHHHYERLAA